MHGPAKVVAAKKDIACALSVGVHRSARDPPTMAKAPAPAKPDMVRKMRNTLTFYMSS